MEQKMVMTQTVADAETEYGFSMIQIALLMELGNAGNIHTYPLPEEEDITDEHYIQAARDLLLRGLLENDIESAFCGVKLTQKARDLLGPMLSPDRVLEVVSAWEGTLPVLVYSDGGPVCTVTQWDGVSGWVGVTCLDCRRLGDWVGDEGFLPDQPFETAAEAEKAVRYDEQLRQSLDRVRSELICYSEEPPVLWAVQDHVRSTMRSIDYSTGTGKESRLYVFLQTETESWILTDRPCQVGETMDSGGGGESGTDEGLWSIMSDSLEYRERIWRDLL